MNKPKDLPFLWVCIYSYDTEHKDDGLHFDDFYLATEYIISNDFALVHIDTDRARKGQFWGVRRRSEYGARHAN